ncbi:MAG: general secretion pathway protein GspK [Candidatus Omnitrophica bacterium]|nr:general secretion pathway protein GspK [Candidatus Omnitrophota bacterium]
MKINKIIIKRKGSVLVLVLWALGLLSVFGLYLGLGARSKIDFLSRMETRSKTLQIAEAGVKQAIAAIGNIDKKKLYLYLNDICSTNNQLFSGVVFDDGVVQLGVEYPANDYSNGQSDEQNIIYGVSDEQSKLNINTAERKELLALLVESAKIDSDIADQIASSIIDWRDADSLSLANGAEDNYYHALKNSYECKDYQFESIEELRYVKGMDYNIFKKIQSYITVYGSGLVNINTASRNVLKALGLSDKLIDKILVYRCGQDEIAANGDDAVFENISSVVAKLSQSEAVSASEVAQLSNLTASGRLTVFSNIFLIQSQANLKNKQDICQIKCFFEKNLDENYKKAGFILGWRMNYLKLSPDNQVEGDYGTE